MQGEGRSRVTEASRWRGDGGRSLGLQYILYFCCDPHGNIEDSKYPELFGQLGRREVLASQGKFTNFSQNFLSN